MPTAVWQRAPAGSYTLLCFVSDAYLATSRVQLSLEVEPAELDDSKVGELLTSMAQNADEGDVGGGTQIAGAMAAALNTQSAPNGTVTAGRRLQSSATEEADRVRRQGVRDNIMSFLVDAEGAASLDGLAVKQKAGTVAALASTPSELSESAIDQGAGLIAGMVSGGSELEIDFCDETGTKSLNITQDVAKLRVSSYDGHVLGSGDEEEWVKDVEHDIHIDTCAVCYGQWLDGGELEVLRGDRSLVDSVLDIFRF